MKRSLRIHPKDNVAVVLEEVETGDTGVYEGGEVVSLEKIEFPHKIAIEDIEQGAEILKYGESIGYAMCLIRKGEFVHTHNLDCERAREGRILK